MSVAPLTTIRSKGLSDDRLALDLPIKEIRPLTFDIAGSSFLKEQSPMALMTLFCPFDPPTEINGAGSNGLQCHPVPNVGKSSFSYVVYPEVFQTKFADFSFRFLRDPNIISFARHLYCRSIAALERHNEDVHEIVFGGGLPDRVLSVDWGRRGFALGAAIFDILLRMSGP